MACHPNKSTLKTPNAMYMTRPTITLAKAPWAVARDQKSPSTKGHKKAISKPPNANILIHTMTSTGTMAKINAAPPNTRVTNRE